MPSADFYRQQAELLLSWATAANDAVVKEQLRKRAQDYLALAAQADERRAAPMSDRSDRPDVGEVNAQARKIEPDKGG
jgi:hypothetical protein